MGQTLSVPRAALAASLLLVGVAGCYDFGALVPTGGPTDGPGGDGGDLGRVDLRQGRDATIEMTVDLAVPDLAAVDLAAPDLATVDLPALDLRRPADLAVAAPDLVRPGTGTWVEEGPALTGDSTTLRGVWGLHAGEVIVVGSAKGAILVGDGAGSWKSIVPLAAYTGSYNDVHGAIDSNTRRAVFLVGAGGTVAVRNENGWTLRSLPGGPEVTGVWARSTTEIFVTTSANGGGGILRSTDQGLTWPTMIGTARPLRAIWGDAARIYAVGEAGLLLVSTNGGTSFATVTTTATANLHDVWGVPASGDAWIAGEGVILHWPPAAQAPVARTMTTPSMYLGVGAATASDLYVVGARGLWRSDNQGQSWIELPRPAGNSNSYNAVWSPAAGEAYAVGTNGSILHRR